MFLDRDAAGGWLDFIQTRTGRWKRPHNSLEARKLEDWFRALYYEAILAYARDR